MLNYHEGVLDWYSHGKIVNQQNGASQKYFVTHEIYASRKGDYIAVSHIHAVTQFKHTSHFLHVTHESLASHFEIVNQ